jgi:hypothetical protein
MSIFHSLLVSGIEVDFDAPNQRSQPLNEVRIHGLTALGVVRDIAGENPIT